MSIKLAFMGFRHGHILGVHQGAGESEDFTIVAACEEDAETRQATIESGIDVKYSSFAKMLDETDCDAIAVGDYYGRRGEIAIEALKRGKHIISDKPICTRLDELQEIRRLSTEKGLHVGCQLDLRNDGLFIRLKELVRAGEIGEVHGVNIFGQHPLLLGVRAPWYFEEGKHGGTINDIGIHGFDIIRWITGMEFKEVVSARSWNAFAKDYPHFHDGAQFMLKMENGCGVLGDVSYFMPGSMGYGMEQYWRTTIFGTKGMLETSIKASKVTFAKEKDQSIEAVEPCPSESAGYLKDFADAIRGKTRPDGLTSEDVLKSSEVSLKVQDAGIRGEGFIPL